MKFRPKSCISQYIADLQLHSTHVNRLLLFLGALLIRSDDIPAVSPLQAFWVHNLCQAVFTGF